MASKKININEELCIGCGLCVNTCQQSSLALVDGKAKVIDANVCDGIGNCLPVCPVNAISFSEDSTVAPQKAAKACPGNSVNTFLPLQSPFTHNAQQSNAHQWPLQLQLVPVKAPFFTQAKLLIAADCTAFAHKNFHETFMPGKVVLIACPKLDTYAYTEKLTEILQENTLTSVTVVRMDVPCCSGLEKMVTTALHQSKRCIPWNVIVLNTQGQVIHSLL